MAMHKKIGLPSKNFLKMRVTTEASQERISAEIDLRVESPYATKQINGQTDCCRKGKS
jgi:hypothetical protein